jgi:hypothetical protein
MKRICTIFKSSNKDEMYLYVDKREGLARVPEPLKLLFGKPIAVMSLLLSSAKKLDRADVDDVLELITSQGYYLQMPPHKEEYKLDLYRTPTQAKY